MKATKLALLFYSLFTLCYSLSFTHSSVATTTAPMLARRRKEVNAVVHKAKHRTQNNQSSHSQAQSHLHSGLLYVTLLTLTLLIQVI